MAADQNSKNKTSKKRKIISCLSFSACFGLYREEHDSNTSKTNDKKLVKYGTRTISGRAQARTVPISPPTLVDRSSVVEAMVTSDDRLIVALQVQSQEVSNKKVHDMFKKNKKICKSSRVMGSGSGSIKFDKNSSSLETRNKPVKLLHSVSLPPLPPTRPKKEKPTAVGEGGGENSENGGQSINPGQLDPMVGALIMTMTLIIMMIWGKICAIICTSAWFYIIPRFRANNDILSINKLKNGLENIDVDSWENKRKVVFEGFLERF